MIPISKEMIFPLITTSISIVNSLEEFEAIKLEINQSIISFDNFNSLFYFRERNKYGQYTEPKIYFYEDIAQRSQSLKREEFVEKCRNAKLSECDTKIAILFFFENKSNDFVWDYILRNKIKDVELPTISTIKWRIKKKLYPEMIKHPKKKE